MATRDELVVVAVTEPTEPMERHGAGQGMPSLALVQLIGRIGSQPFVFYPPPRARGSKRAISPYFPCINLTYGQTGNSILNCPQQTTLMIF
jgi:hypothetical protein